MKALKCLLVLTLFVSMLVAVGSLSFGAGHVDDRVDDNVRVIQVPQDVKVEKFTGKHVVVSNLSDQGVFQLGARCFKVIGDFLYIVKDKPMEIIKISLENGKIAARGGERGEGPGQFLEVRAIVAHNGKPAVACAATNKILFFDDNLNFTKEHRFETRFTRMHVDSGNRMVMGKTARSGSYFQVYSPDFRKLHTFGKPKRTPEQERKQFTCDFVSILLPMKTDNAVWVAFYNRYDLRFYKNDALAVEIREEDNFLRQESRKLPNGRIVKIGRDFAFQLAEDGERLYYFYLKDLKYYCDIFQMGSYDLLRRIDLGDRYSAFARHKGTTFYSLAVADNDEGDILLVKFRL